MTELRNGSVPIEEIGKWSRSRDFRKSHAQRAELDTLFEEIGVAEEELRAPHEELRAPHEELLATRAAIEAERGVPRPVRARAAALPRYGHAGSHPHGQPGRV